MTMSDARESLPVNTVQYPSEYGTASAFRTPDLPTKSLIIVGHHVSDPL